MTLRVSPPSLSLALATLLAGAGTAAAQGAHRFTEVSISPDGKRLAWIGPTSRSGGSAFRRRPDAPTPHPTRSRFRRRTPERVEVVWSADGKRLAILATANRGAPAIYLSAMRRARHGS